MALKYRSIVILAALLLSLSGCFGPKPEEELYLIFEKAAKQEKQMVQEVESFEKLEQHNKELYNTILQDGKEDSQLVMSIIEQALQSIQDREKTLTAEYDILKKAQDEMKDADKYIAEIKESKLKEHAQNVKRLYKERYLAFQQMRDAYKKALDAEKTLYVMLQAKDTKLKAIVDQVKVVNTLYENVATENEKFNSYTKQYNEEKIEFYKQAHFKVKEMQD